MKNIFLEYDLFIFDLDNAVIQTEKYHYLAWIKTLQNILGNDFIISFEYFCEKFHSKDSENINKYLINQLLIENIDEIIENKNKNYLDIINENKENIKLVDGVELFLNMILENNKKFIIVSNSLSMHIEFYLNLFPILKNAIKYYSRELFVKKKPNIECYLKVINDFPTQKKISFEYNITGIHSLSHVKDIKTVFVNNKKYVHYQFILKNYHDIIIIRDYTELNNYYVENKCINTLRLLAVDMVEKANSGHPGMPLGCAPMMFILWAKIMNFNPKNPEWYQRDRFILSNGHGCALLYSMLHLLGYDYTLSDLKSFRQLHSKTPGHPEFNTKLGIEISTGPLGQGIANGVGMAISSKKLNINNFIYVMCGDGCLMEGISYEAASLAGHLSLNNLIILYDDNGITIDGETDITFTEDVRGRFKALNWNVLEVLDGDSNITDIENKILSAKQSIDKPSIIFVKTTIGYGANNSGKSSVHGAPLGKENTRNLKKYFGFPEDESFIVDKDVEEYFSTLQKNKIIYYDQFENNYNELEDINEKSIQTSVNEISTIKNGTKDMSTRDISNLFLNKLVKNIPNMIVGSADLAESNKTFIISDFLKKDNFEGQYLHYGIREHSMMSIANGISTYGILPIVSTFLVFITYCLASIRMAALSKHKVIYVLTHDSFLLGEDGPTHQPVESLTILRSIPNLLTIRPCDTNEVSGAYQCALNYDGPTALIFTRHALPNMQNSDSEKMKKGAYIIYEPESILNSTPDIILVATGSEVSLAFNVIQSLKDKFKVRLVSMPCFQLFDKQSEQYKSEILPKHITKFSIEAGTTLSFYKYVNYPYGIDTFGESGNINDLREYFGFTVEKIKDYILRNV